MWFCLLDDARFHGSCLVANRFDGLFCTVPCIVRIFTIVIVFCCWFQTIYFMLTSKSEQERNLLVSIILRNIYSANYLE